MAFALSSLTGSYSLNGNGSLDVGGTITESGGSFTYANGVELTGFKSGSISFSAGSVDNSTRGEGGWAAAAPGARSCTLDITYNKIDGAYSSQSATSDPQYNLREMFSQVQADWSSKAVAIKYTSKAKNSAGKWVTSGFFGLFIPTSYSESQSGGGDNDGTAVECSMSFASYGQIHSIQEVEA